MHFVHFVELLISKQLMHDDSDDISINETEKNNWMLKNLEFYG